MIQLLVYAVQIPCIPPCSPHHGVDSEQGRQLGRVARVASLVGAELPPDERNPQVARCVDRRPRHTAGEPSAGLADSTHLTTPLSVRHKPTNLRVFEIEQTQRVGLCLRPRRTRQCKQVLLADPCPAVSAVWSSPSRPLGVVRVSRLDWSKSPVGTRSNDPPMCYGSPRTGQANYLGGWQAMPALDFFIATPPLHNSFRNRPTCLIAGNADPVF